MAIAKILIMIIMFVSINSCATPSTENSNVEDYILPAAVLGTIGYLTYELSKHTPPLTYQDSSIKICERGYYGGCCSHHGGLLGCLNYEVVCQDLTISDSCTCPYQKCVFD